MKEIPITQGFVALIDDEDYDRVLAEGPWFAEIGRNGDYIYVSRNFRQKDSKKGLLRLHRFVVNAKSDELVDHRDGWGLNNQKYNLRVCNRIQNQGNRTRKKEKIYSSKFKGVCWDKSKNRFVVHVKNKHLGRFDNEIKAALFYDVAARAYFGEFAKTNFNLCPLTVGVSDA